MADYDRYALEDAMDSLIRLVAALVAQRARQEPQEIIEAALSDPDLGDPAPPPPPWR